MRQRALQDGVLSAPYQFVRAGEEFDWPTPLKWAEPLEPVKKPTVRKKSEPEPVNAPEPVAGDPDEVI